MAIIKDNGHFSQVYLVYFVDHLRPYRLLDCGFDQTLFVGSKLPNVLSKNLYRNGRQSKCRVQKTYFSVLLLSVVFAQGAKRID